MVNIFTDLYYLTFVQELNKSLSTWQPTLLPNSKGQGFSNPCALSSTPTHPSRSPGLLGLPLLTEGPRAGACSWVPRGLELGEPKPLTLNMRRASRFGSEEPSLGPQARWPGWVVREERKEEIVGSSKFTLTCLELEGGKSCSSRWKL